MPPIETWRKFLTANRKEKLRGGYLRLEKSEGVYVGKIKSIKMWDSELVVWTEGTVYDGGRGVYKKHDQREFKFDILAGPDPKQDRDCISWEGGGRKDSYTLELLNAGVQHRKGFDLSAFAAL